MADKQATRPDPTPRRGKPAWKAIFLEELEKWGVVDHAIHAAGVHKSTVYEARERDAKFRAAWDEAEGRILALMEVVARQRAMTGQRIPVIFQGKVTEHVLEVDNGLLKWLLAKLKPSVYADKPSEHVHEHRHRHTVKGSIDLKALPVDQLRTLRDILTAAVHPGDGDAGTALGDRAAPRRKEPV